MTLLQLIAALGTQNVMISVIDADTDDVIIEFKSQGIAGVESELSSRNVRKWTIDNALHMSVKLESVI